MGKGWKTLADLEPGGKRCLVRVDFNVPFAPGTQTIIDDSRISAALPTIKGLLGRGASLIVCSHLGRPKGKRVPELKMAPVRQRFAELLGADVVECGGPAKPEVLPAARSLEPGQVGMLENLRFDPGEESNDDDFSKNLASLADVYVNDAFGAAHRTHASVVGVTEHLPSYAGLLMEKELEMLGRVLGSHEEPSIALIGGAKVADKIGVISNLLAGVDMVLIGGGMVAAFLRAGGMRSGAATLDEAELETAGMLLRQHGDKLGLPTDVTVAGEFSPDATASVVNANAVAENDLILDIGPDTADAYAREIERAKTILWNGPMGVAEWEQFSHGTRTVADAVSSNPAAVSVVGGGSTAEVVSRLGLEQKITHVSTGGGASLEFLEGRILPGVAALGGCRPRPDGARPIPNQGADKCVLP